MEVKFINKQGKFIQSQVSYNWDMGDSVLFGMPKTNNWIPPDHSSSNNLHPSNLSLFKTFSQGTSSAGSTQLEVSAITRFVFLPAVSFTSWHRDFVPVRSSADGCISTAIYGLRKGFLESLLALPPIPILRARNESPVHQPAVLLLSFLSASLVGGLGVCFSRQFLKFLWHEDGLKTANVGMIT